VDVAADSSVLGEAGLVQRLRMCAVLLPPFHVFYLVSFGSGFLLYWQEFEILNLGIAF